MEVIKTKKQQTTASALSESRRPSGLPVRGTSLQTFLYRFQSRAARNFFRASIKEVRADGEIAVSHYDSATYFVSFLNDCAPANTIIEVSKTNADGSGTLAARLGLLLRFESVNELSLVAAEMPFASSTGEPLGESFDADVAIEKL